MPGGKKLFLVAALVCLVFVGVASYGDFREVWRHLVNFPLANLLLAVILALVNYLARFLRWLYYLRVLRLSVPFTPSLLIFLAGLAMTITPGKVGELVKSYLLRERAGIPVAASAPAVVMERITDLVSVALMGMVGLALLPPPVAVFLGSILLGVGAAIYLLTTRHTDRMLGWPVLKRWSADIREARAGLRELSRPIPLLTATVLGFVAWVSEGVALWVVLTGLGAEADILFSLPIYAGSTLVGAATTLPGGLVGTEGAMIALLQQIGAERDVAATATLLVRVVTLWLAVIIGLAALAWLHWRLPGTAPQLRPQPEAAEVGAKAGEGSQRDG